MPVSYGSAPVPFVHSYPVGLGLFTPPEDNSQSSSSSASSEPPWWAKLIEPFAQAGASRLAYGKTYPPYGGGFQVQTPGGQYTGTSFGGLSPQALMLILGALGLAVILSRR